MTKVPQYIHSSSLLGYQAIPSSPTTAKLRLYPLLRKRSPQKAKTELHLNEHETDRSATKDKDTSETEISR